MPLHVVKFYLIGTAWRGSFVVAGGPDALAPLCGPVMAVWVSWLAVDQFNFAMLVLRLVFGLFLAYHGYNKFFGPGGLTGTTGWFGSIGMKWPAWQARIAATTELGSGVLLAAGLLTPLAAAGMIGIMVVAIVVAHWKVGFFIFKPNQGWEYCASIAVAAFCIATIGPGEWSLDHAFDIEFEDWWGAVVAFVIGVGGAILQLTTSYRPKKTA